MKPQTDSILREPHEYVGLQKALRMLEMDNGVPHGWYDSNWATGAMWCPLNTCNYLALLAEQSLYNGQQYVGFTLHDGVEVGTDTVLYLLICGEHSEVQQFLAHNPHYLPLHQWLDLMFGEITPEELFPQQGVFK